MMEAVCRGFPGTAIEFISSMKSRNERKSHRWSITEVLDAFLDQEPFQQSFLRRLGRHKRQQWVPAIQVLLYEWNPVTIHLKNRKATHVETLSDVDLNKSVQASILLGDAEFFRQVTRRYDHRFGP